MTFFAGFPEITARARLSLNARATQQEASHRFLGRNPRTSLALRTPG